MRYTRKRPLSPAASLGAIDNTSRFVRWPEATNKYISLMTSRRPLSDRVSGKTRGKTIREVGLPPPGDITRREFPIPSFLPFPPTSFLPPPPGRQPPFFTEINIGTFEASVRPPVLHLTDLERVD